MNFRRLGLAAILFFALGACSDEEANAPEPVEEVAADKAAEESAAPVEEVKLAERRVLEVQGEVLLDGKPAVENQPIAENSKIETGKGALATITVGPKSIIEIRENTEMQFQPKNDERGKEISVKLAFGKLWNIFAGETSYEVETETAVAGVRGTAFYIEAPKKGPHYICTCDGEVELAGLGKKSFKPKTVKATKKKHIAFKIVSKKKKQKAKKAKGGKDHPDLRMGELMEAMPK